MNRPIIFSTPMARALIDGRKTQTRRISKAWVKVQPGDRLWVRESWRVGKKWDDKAPKDVPLRLVTAVFAAGGSIAGMTTPPKDRPRTPAEYTPDFRYPEALPEVAGWIGKLRPAIHMPRWISRLTLIVTAVRIERLRAITEVDAKAEGVEQIGVETGRVDNRGEPIEQGSYVAAYSELWERLHGPDSWNENPEVVALSFEVVRHNIDALEP